MHPGQGAISLAATDGRELNTIRKSHSSTTIPEAPPTPDLRSLEDGSGRFIFFGEAYKIIYSLCYSDTNTRFQEVVEGSSSLGRETPSFALIGIPAPYT